MLDYYKCTPTPNGPILTESKTLKTMVSSSAEAETGGTFENAQNIIPLRHILDTVYLHHQPNKSSPIIIDNLISQGILASLIKPRKSKTWYIRYCWLEDRIFRNHVQLIWKQGIHNWDDYFTKHHPPAYHRLMIPKHIVHFKPTLLFPIYDINTCKGVLLSPPRSDLRQSITITSVTITHILTFVRHFQPEISANKYLYLKIVRSTNTNRLVVNS